MDCSATVFVDEFSIFSTFSVISLVFGCPECSSSSTDIQPSLKRECHLKTAVRLKQCSPRASQNISRVSSVVDLPQNIMQTRCLILPSIPDKKKHEDEKALV
jgi:hypothetical protein